MHGAVGVPTMFIAELDHPDFERFNLASLRTGIMAGAPCPIEVMRRVNESMNMGEVTIAYGMTETSPVSFQSATDDPLERRVSTVGRIHPYVEVKVVDLEGRVVIRGERGAANSAPAATASCSAIGTKRKKPPTCSMPTAGCIPAISP
jgi:fatty-acyl-CoA synthase